MTDRRVPDDDAAHTRRRDDSLHDDLAAIGRWADPVVVPDPELLEAHEVRTAAPATGPGWPRMLAAAAAVLVVVAGVWVLARQRDDEPAEPDAASGWVETEPAPLAARNAAQAVWTGREVVVFAGTTQPECPVCDYAQYGDTLHDAAAYDPTTDTWRTIAPLPDDASYVGQSVAMGGDVYWLSAFQPDTQSSGNESTLYRYQPGADRWTRVELPPEPLGPAQLTATDDTLLLYASTDEAGDFADWAWSPAATEQAVVAVPGQWTRLPDDPLGPSFDRHYLDGGDSLLLFTRSIASVGSAAPPAILGAALSSGEWTPLPEGEQLVTPFVSDAGVAWAPLGGGADGGEVNNWGRTIPNGGGFDPTGGGWFALPQPVPEDLNGLIGDETSFLGGLHGSVLDRSTATYRPVPVLPDGLTDGFGQTLTAIGTGSFFSFGGTTPWPAVTSGTGAQPTDVAVHRRAFVWSARGGADPVDTTVPGEVTETTTGDTTIPPDTTVTADLATAVWNWAADRVPQADDTELQLLVTRLECAGGVTGEVLDADVVEMDDQVIITTWVKPLPAGDYSCPGNDAVPHTVTLSTALGSRSVVDGACVVGEATQTSFCEGGGIRLGGEPTSSPSTIPPATTDPATSASDPTGELADLATDALCGAAIRLLRDSALENVPQLVDDLRALPTDGLSSGVLGGFLVAVDGLEARYEAARGTLEGYDSAALSSFLTDTCGRGEVPTYYVMP